MTERIKALIESGKYQLLREELEDLNVADIAEAFEELPKEDLIRIFRILPKSIAADVFSYLSIEMEQDIITSLTEGEAAGILDELAADDAADLIDEMPASVVKKVLAKASPETRRDINHLLNYPEDSAGSIMTVEFVDLKESLTVEQAIDRIRKTGVDKETIDICYVLDMHRKLIGTVALRYLLLSSPEDLIGTIMHENVVTISTRMDQEHVANLFKKYDFTTMPVVDSENRLVGIITVDDIVDIIEQEATEDIERMAAIVPSDQSYMKTSILETCKKRIPWLLILMVSATFTSMVINRYEDSIIAAGYFVLTAFIPMLMDTGGNCGSQSSVSVIRAISLGEARFKDIFKIVLKEAGVALICGGVLAVTNFVKLMAVDRVSMVIASIVCLTLILTVFVSKIIGAVLPLCAKQIKLDPAVMASPLITTIVDVLSLIIYFEIASRFLHL